MVGPGTDGEEQMEYGASGGTGVTRVAGTDCEPNLGETDIESERNMRNRAGRGGRGGGGLGRGKGGEEGAKG